MVVLSDDSIMLIGGNANGASSKTYFYQPSTDSWSNGPAMSSGRQSHMCSTFVDPNSMELKVAVAGGSDSSGNQLSTTEIFSTKGQTWESGIFNGQNDALNFPLDC